MRIAVEGNIGSGKSTAMKALAAAFPGVPVFPEPVEEWEHLLELFYAAPAQWGLTFNLKVLLSFRAPGRTPDCIVERSTLATRHVFGQLLYNDGNMTQHEWDVFKEYHDALAWKPDVVLYIHTPADVCATRVAERGRPSERALDDTYLRRVEFQYQNMLRFVDVPVVRFDGTKPPEDLHTALIAEVTNIFSASTNAKPADHRVPEECGA